MPLLQLLLVVAEVEHDAPPLPVPALEQGVPVVHPVRGAPAVVGGTGRRRRGGRRGRGAQRGQARRDRLPVLQGPLDALVVDVRLAAGRRPREVAVVALDGRVRGRVPDVLPGVVKSLVEEAALPLLVLPVRVFFVLGDDVR